MEHLASRMFVGYGDLESPNLPVKLLYLFNLLGSPAVVAFFVLSGLFIAKTIYQAWYDGRWSWRRYLEARMSRLFVVLIPALLVTYVADTVSSAYGYIDDSGDFATLLGNLIFLQTIFFKQFGSNGPLWSLSNEFWYYMAYPLVVAFVLSSRLITKVACLVGFVFIIVLIGINKSLYFVLWIAGALAIFFVGGRAVRSKLAFFAALMFLIFAFAMRPLVDRGRLISGSIDIPVFFPDILVALAMVFLIRAAWGFFSGRRYMHNLRIDRWVRRGAGFSFSLYVIHYPIINMFYYVATHYGFSGLRPNALTVSLEIFAVFCLGVIALLFAMCTEDRTSRVRKWLRGFSVVGNG